MSRIGPLRLFSTLPAPFDIVGDRVGKGGLQLIERLCLEGLRMRAAAAIGAKE
jgi:hypothetical protein